MTTLSSAKLETKEASDPNSDTTTESVPVVLENNRILIVDDQLAIHDDFNKILTCRAAGPLDELEKALFGKSETTKVFERPYEVDHATQGQAAFALVERAVQEKRPYATAFIDMRMPPGWDGLQTIKAIRSIDAEMSIVLCTAYTDHSWETIAAELGETDKLLILKKPFDPIEVIQLARALRERWSLQRKAQLHTTELEILVRKRTAELETALHRDHLHMEELKVIVEQRTSELRTAALHDTLTGLPNRALFYDRLSHALKQRQRDCDYRFAVLFIDFDRFKVINDSLGHAYGDLLLKCVAQRLGIVLRPGDTPSRQERGDTTSARLGGDEFCILLEGLRREEDATVVAQRLLEELSQPYILNGRRVICTASIGITLSNLNYSSAEDMLRDADTAMYRAKNLGRARYVVFDQKMHELAMQRLLMESDIRGAVEHNELHLLFQPIVSLITGQANGAEALVRWNHPKCGIISPVDFIPLAEETGIILPIGEWVLRQGVAQLAHWHKQVGSGPAPYLSVNVSRKQLSDPRFEVVVREVLARHPIPPSSLVLEITETTLTDDPTLAREFLEKVRALGVRVYLDDFGTGLSSLGSLQDFPLDGLKLDRSFLRKNSTPRRAAACIHSVMTLAGDLEMELIAEGVETLEHVALLQALRCDRGQGYFFARPTSPEEAFNFFSTPYRAAAG